MKDLRSSLSFARKIRTCPPITVLKDPQEAENVKKHLMVCPDCPQPSAVTEDPWEELVQSLRFHLSEIVPQTDGEGLRRGEIRLLRPDLARWHEGFYYSPPAVLLLRPIEGSKGAFRAAQIHFDPDLAGPGDLVLQHSRTGTTDLLVECWNTYPVCEDQMGARLGAVSEEVLAAVSSLGEDPWKYPDWAVVPSEMEEEDVRIYFRELEVEVAFLFARDAVSSILQRMEGDHFRIQDESGCIEKDLLRLRPGIRIPSGWRNVEEALALAELQADDYALAADEKAADIFGANFVVLKNHLVREISPLHFELLSREREGETVVVGGRFMDLPSCKGILRLLAFLAPADEPLIAAQQIIFDPESGHFSARFSEKGRGPSEIKVALLCYVDEND